jgi:hypothetical protein
MMIGGMTMMNKWSQKDLDTLKKFYVRNNMSVSTLAIRLNRTQRAIAVKANRIGLVRGNHEQR